MVQQWPEITPRERVACERLLEELERTPRVEGATLPDRPPGRAARWRAWLYRILWPVRGWGDGRGR